MEICQLRIELSVYVVAYLQQRITFLCKGCCCVSPRYLVAVVDRECDKKPARNEKQIDGTNFSPDGTKVGCTCYGYYRSSNQSEPPTNERTGILGYALQTFPKVMVSELVAVVGAAAWMGPGEGGGGDWARPTIAGDAQKTQTRSKLRITKSRRPWTLCNIKTVLSGCQLQLLTGSRRCY